MPANFEYLPTALSVDFEDLPPDKTISGIVGNAFDLGPFSKHRLAIKRGIPSSKNPSDFSLTVWVKAFINSNEEYEILSSGKHINDKFYGWEISVQKNGAWKFDVRTDYAEYNYSPTSSRQTIRDGEWHLLSVAYHGNDEELTFYYDGEKMAIYYAPGIKEFFAGSELIIGNSSKNNRSFGFLETGWDSFYGWIDDINIYDRTLDEKSILDYYSKHADTDETRTITNPAAPFIKVSAFNIWKGGNEFGKEAGKKRIIESLEALDADVNLIVETYGSGAELADALGCQLYLISTNLSIVSKYPIVKTYRTYKPFNSGGVQIRLPDGRLINVFCIWLSSKPQYFIKGLTDQDGWPLQDYLNEENKTRGKDIQAILADIEEYIKVSDSIPLILGGDFNSGSHLDWTEQTKSSHNNYVVPWPVSLAMRNAGFKDSFREIYPDPLREPGLTWSPIRNFPLKDRIDYIYYMGKGLKAIHSNVTDNHPQGWPSDHAAISSILQILETKE